MRYCIGKFLHIRPRFEKDQIELLEWTAKLHEVAAAHADPDRDFTPLKEKLLALGSGKEKIQKRGFQISDPLEEDFEKMRIYPVTLSAEGARLKDRMLFFNDQISAVFEQMYPSGASLPEHLIHVTCTGYVAPSPAQKLVSQRNPSKNCTVTHAYHMGCYASIPAMRIAVGSLTNPLSSPVYSVDIVHTEMCSLHLHPLRHSTDQLIVQSLFADGFIKYSAFSEDACYPRFTILTLLEEIIPHSINSMTWSCDDVCHAMTLDKNVPVFITRMLKGYLTRLADAAMIGIDHVLASAYFAIHPGGPKILQHIQNLFSLSEKQLRHSFYVMQQYGNMSSATLPHIWERMLNDDAVADGSHIVSLAFGPGLSIAGAIFQKSGIR